MKLGLCHRIAGLLVALGCLLPAVSVAIDLNADRAISTDGTVQLHWASDGQAVRLQRASSADFVSPQLLYQGTDTASLRTGLSEGDYFYRVSLAATEPAWSAPVHVAVRHHGAVRTWTLFGVGASVFLAILGLILWGWAREAKHD